MKLLACLTAILLLASPVTAADFDKGVAAYNSGDYATAVREFRPLAEQGDASAQYNLGVMYENGRGVPQDYAAAVGWYRKAAEQGEAYAQYNLGVMYDNGRGVPQDYVHAHKWFNLAATSGNKIATKNRNIIAKKMTPAQIAEAQKLAREWIERRKK
jgi:TPR repeat protein